MDIGKYCFDGERKLRLRDEPTADTGRFSSKEDAAPHFEENLKTMVEQQGRLYASAEYALLIIFQAMDAAGKDSAVSHVMSGLNPQGTEVYSFKQPSAEELRHDYLWRTSRCLPERGKIGIFNRSYYEEVLVVRVHNLIGGEHIPQKLTDHIWDKRYGQIVDFERYLTENGIIPVKFFLNISKDEQKERLLARLDDKSKNWKFSEADVKERRFWDDYQKAYEEAINRTATKQAPWYVIPSDKKWYSRLVISEVIAKTFQSLGLEYPELGRDQQDLLESYKALFEEEKR